jgi:hypothetical protein
VLGRLATEQGRAAATRAPGDTVDDLGQAGRIQGTDGHVVEQKEGSAPTQTRSSTNIATRSTPTVS